MRITSISYQIRDMYRYYFHHACQLPFSQIWSETNRNFVLFQAPGPRHYYNHWILYSETRKLINFSVKIIKILQPRTYQLGIGNTKYLKPDVVFVGTSTNFLAYAQAFYGGMWSFDGWNQLNFIVEELRNPVRDFPRAIYLSIPLVTIVYVLVNIAYFTVLSPQEVMTSSAVATTFAYRTLGPTWAWIVPVGVVLSTLGSTNGTVFTSARFVNVASRRSHLPRFLSYIDVIHNTPSAAVFFECLIALLFVIPDSSNFSTMMDYFSLCQWVFYGMSCFAVVILRYKAEYKDKPRVYRVPLIIPIISSLGSLYLVLAPIIDDPSIKWVYVLCLLFGGYIFYIPIFILGWRPRNLMRKVTLLIQKVFNLAPSEKDLSD